MTSFTHESVNTSTKIKRWYLDCVRPFIAVEDPERLKELDRDIYRIEQLESKLEKPLSVCFVGGSGVGKSTLINTLVAGKEFVVPSGGVGPLTAQALEIQFGESPSFVAFYHPANQLWKLGFAIESALRLERKDATESAKSEFGEALDIETIEEVEKLADADNPDSRSKSEHLQKQAQLIVTGNQEGSVDLAYLADCVRECIGKLRFWGTERSDTDASRIERLKQIFCTDQRTVESIFKSDVRASDFREQLHDHASGYLSPTMKRLEVTWNSGLLRKQLRLVDLPGLGIAGDVYREITEKWVRNDAQAIILVVNYRGITEADANLLRTSGFLTRFLHSMDDPAADPLKLIVVVVRTDEIADERYAKDLSKEHKKKKRDHLVDAIAECHANIKAQVRSRIQEAWKYGSEPLAEGKSDTLDRIIEEMQIFPVSAVQYRKFLADDEDDRSFLSKPEQSGIPSLEAALGELALDFAQNKAERFVEAYDSFHERLHTLLQRIRQRWEERDHANQEADELAREVAVFLQPLREQFRARQGGFRTFLKETIPSKIENVVLQASVISQRSIKSYLRGLQGVHWKTLQAAVRKEGTFYGTRHINLPADFSQTFEEPIAEAWSKTILKELRKTTKDYADDCLSLVDQFVAWAKEQGARVKAKAIEAERDAVASDTKYLATVGKEAVDDLRGRVKEELSRAIENPIRKKCKSFVDANQHRGTGTKVRILTLFDELAQDAIDAALKPAGRVLTHNYQTVEQEILEVFGSHPDPLESSAATIVDSHEAALKRSDDQKRRAKLKLIEEILQQSLAGGQTEQVAFLKS